MNPKRLALGLTMTAIGCGNPVANGQFQGKPIATYHGVVSGQLGGPNPANPAVGILWVGSNGNQVAGDVTAIKATSFPGGFDLNVFAPPPDSVLDSFVDNGGTIVAQFAEGYPFAFDDVDGDGTFKLAQYGLVPPDQFIGYGANNALLYVKKQPTSDGVGVDLQGKPLSNFRVSNVVTNWELATPGYHLGEGVCGPDGTPLSKVTVKVVPDSSSIQMTVEPPSSEIIKTEIPGSCLAFF